MEKLFPYCIPDISDVDSEKVEDLYLSVFGNIEKINISVLNRFTNLKSLLISDTNVIFDCDLSNWELEYLYLYRCGLSKIPDVLLSLPCLKELEISDDALSEIRDDIYEIKTLKKISIDSKIIISIPENILYTNIEEIYVSDCFPESLNNILQIPSLKIITLKTEYNKMEKDIMYKNGFIISDKTKFIKK